MDDVTFHGGYWRVRSNSRDGWHTVGLSPERCSCDGFRFRRSCRHLDAAREAAEASRIAEEVFGEAVPDDPVLARLLG